MRNWRRVIALAMGVLAFGVAAHADMMAISFPDTAYRQAPAARLCDDRRHTPLFASLAETSIVDPFSLSATRVAFTQTQAEPTGEAPALRIRSDGQSSLNLCLYALIGLGLCRSAPWARRLSLAAMPEWFHDGGPFQIGHSFVVSPDCRCAAPACFIQPDHTKQDHIPRYRRGMVVSLWRTSQFTPTTLASRAPPLS